MYTRTLSRWLMSIALAIFALVTINLLVATSPAQGRHTAILLNCSGSIQACIDAANDGDTILIAAGTYTESLTLSRPISLTGVSSDRTIIHALAGQRVLTVTGATIGNSVVISGLTFTGGDATNGQGIDVFPTPTYVPLTPMPGSQARHFMTTTPPESPILRDRLMNFNVSLPLSWLTRHSLNEFDPARDGVGGGLLITNSAQPQLQAVRLINSLAGYGGGLYVYGSQPVKLTQVEVLSNVAVIGGGLYANAPLALLQSSIVSNTSLSIGGGTYVSGTMTLQNSSVTHNEGDGLYVQGNLVAHHSTISFNTPSNSWFAGNNDASSINQFSGVLSLDNVTLEGNYGLPFPTLAAVLATNSRVWITDTRFIDNATNACVTIWLGGGSARIVNSLFTRHSSFCSHTDIDAQGNVEIIHSTFAAPDYIGGGAVRIEYGSLYVTDTVIMNRAYGIDSTQPNLAHEDYNLFFDNYQNTYNMVAGGHSLIGDPKFVDPLNGDYHLQFGSAAIDRGVDAGVYTDLDGNPRPSGAGFDIGAYEFMNDTRYVATTGDDTSNACLNQTAPCATVQHAVDVAADQDEVHIASGTYAGLSVRPRADVTTTGVVTQVVYISKTVTLRGGYTTTNWLVSDPQSNPTVLDARAQGRVVYVTGNVSPTIDGLRLTNGNPHAAMDGSTCTGWWDCETVGAAVYAWQASLTLNDNQIDNNQYGRFDGGSVYINGGNAHLTHNTVMSNVNGGGIALANSTGVISGNLIIGNSGNGDGGGILVKYGSATLINNSIISNTADYVCGGGVCIAYGEAILSNNTIRGNSILSGQGGGVDVFSSTATLHNNLIADNHAGSFYPNGGGVSVEFNSNADLAGNIIRHNFATASGAKGGGVVIYANSQAALTGNTIEGNVSGQGAGVSVDRYSSAMLINNVIAQDTGADALYVGGSVVQGIHNTLADTANSQGIYVTDYTGTSSVVALTNTIVASHTIGINVTQGNTVTLDSVLWYGTPITVAQTATTTITSRNDVYGDPKFVDPLHGDYHLQVGSAAIDHGVDAGVYTDLDGNVRPYGAGFDIGAYELTGTPAGGNRYVATTGDDTSNVCLDRAAPCATLQHAIDVANDGDEVRIASGVYTDVHVREAITQVAYISKSLTIQGGYTTTDWLNSNPISNPTTLDAQGQGRVMTVIGTITATIEGFNLTGGNAAGLGGDPVWDLDAGGGLDIVSATVTISGNAIYSNSAQSGGGIYIGDHLWGITRTVMNNRITNNTAYWGGGGLNAEGSTILLSNNLISTNTASYQGGGVRVEGVDYGTMDHNLFLNNRASGGGGLWIDESYAIPVRHNTFLGNRAESQLPGKGGGLVIFGIDIVVEGNLIISNTAETGGGGIYATNGGGNNELINNVVARNTSGNYVGAGIYDEDYYISQIAHTTLVGNGQGSGLYSQGPTLLRNVIISNFATGVQYAGSTPLSIDGVLWYSNTQNTSGAVNIAHSYTGDPHFVDPLHNDYHLRRDSAAIDHGVDAGIYTDLDGNVRPYGAGFDIGAYEFVQGPASGNRYVATTGVDAGNSCTNSSLPCATLQHAIDVANDGDEVRVATGGYTDVHVREAITQVAYISKSLTVAGGYTTTDWLNSNPISNPTTLDAQGQGRVLAIMGEVTVTLAGVNIAHGSAIGLGGYPGGFDAGGGVLAISATVTLNQDTIVNNNGGMLGGGIFAQRPLTVIASDFLSNTANSTGGGADVEATVVITGSRFVNNRVTSGCGAGICSNATVIVTNSLFENNGNALAGGGIRAAMLYAANTDFIGNAGHYGGGANAVGAYIANGRFERNSAAWGGGLNAQAPHVENTSFFSNTSSQTGGGGYFGDAEIYNSRFEGNSSTTGGGLYATSSALVSNTEFISNTAGGSGGGLYSTGDSQVINAVFSNNHSSKVGAALVLTGTGHSRFVYVTIADVDVNPQPAIAVMSGTLGITDTIIASHTIAISNTGGSAFEDYNLFFNTVTSTVGMITGGGHSLIGDPKFVDPLHGDYHLQIGSAATDHGVDAGVYTDLDGHPRPIGAGFDMGAYEYQGAHYLWLPLVRK